MPEESENATEEMCIVTQLVNATRLTRFLRDLAIQEFYAQGQSYDDFEGHFYRHGGTDEDLDVVFGDLAAADVDEEEEETPINVPEEPEGMSLEQFTKLMGG